MARGRPKGEGSLVTRSSDGRLGAYVTLPGGTRVYGWCPREDNTPRRQEQVRRKLLNERDANRLSADARQTLAAYLATWLVSRPDWSAPTRDRYRASVERHIAPALGATPLADLTPLAIERWLAGLAARLPGAATKARAVLVSALTDAVRLGLLPSNPARAARPQSPPSSRAAHPGRGRGAPAAGRGGGRAAGGARHVRRLPGHAARRAAGRALGQRRPGRRDADGPGGAALRAREGHGRAAPQGRQPARTGAGADRGRRAAPARGRPGARAGGGRAALGGARPGLRQHARSAALDASTPAT